MLRKYSVLLQRIQQHYGSRGVHLRPPGSAAASHLRANRQ